MRIDKIKAKPNANSAIFEMIFEIELYTQNRYEIPLSIKGQLLTKDGKKLANLDSLLYEKDIKFELGANDYRSRYEQKNKINITAQLNEKAIEVISSNRNTNAKGDVELKIDLYIVALISKTALSHFKLLDPQKININDLNYTKIVTYEHDSNFSTSMNNMWVLSGEGGPVFIEEKVQNIVENYTISSSDWVHDFCPVFNVGNYTVFEFAVPVFTNGDDELGKRVDTAIIAVQKMKKEINNGEWNDVIVESRAISELFRNKEEIQELLKRDGLSEAAVGNLNNTLQELFDFASKFHHKEDKGKKVASEIKASKEDANLIYSLSVAFVNLISNKNKKLNQ